MSGGLLPKKNKKPFKVEPIEHDFIEEDPQQVKIRLWRKQQLLAAGYSLKSACMLGDAPHVDLHAARVLITKTTEELAVDILL